MYKYIIISLLDISCVLAINIKRVIKKEEYIKNIDNWKEARKEIIKDYILRLIMLVTSGILYGYLLKTNIFIYINLIYSIIELNYFYVYYRTHKKRLDPSVEDFEIETENIEELKTILKEMLFRVAKSNKKTRKIEEIENSIVTIFDFINDNAGEEAVMIAKKEMYEIEKELRKEL